MLETLLLVLVTGVSGLVIFLVTYARWYYGSLEKLGIPVAKPHFLLGSDPDGYKIVFQDRDMERFRKFGPVFGVYEGRIPRVFVVDPDMIRRIMVKDFDHFYDRSSPDWGHELWDNLLDFLPGEKWKTTRSALTPMFTASRIRSGGKKYFNYMDKYVKELNKKFTGTSMKLDMKEFMIPAFVEFTAEYFLAIKLSGQGDIKENYVYKMVLESMGDGEEASFFFTLMTVYPFILKVFNVFSQEGIKKFLATLDQVIKARRATKVDASSGKDFIDVMLSMFDDLESPEFKRLGITKITVQAQAFEMFVAGFDSIVGTLTILPYYLASNPEIQEKVLEEIDQCYNVEQARKDTSGLPDLPYLSACIKEAIRLSPSFHRLERLCMKEWTYNENGINVTIPKGMSVIVPAWATNRNPKAFKDPEEFRPERYFRNENGIDGTVSSNEARNLMQYAMTSFGHGPRNCPGSRLGMEMVKAGMVRMLEEFKFECRDDTKVQLQEGIPMLTRYKPIYLNVVKRQEQ